MASKPVFNTKKKKRWELFFFALPFMILVLMFAYIPLAGWYFAFIEYRVGTPILSCDFIGLDNFVRLFQTKAFIRALKNTLIYSSSAGSSFTVWFMRCSPPKAPSTSCWRCSAASRAC